MSESKVDEIQPSVVQTAEAVASRSWPNKGRPRLSTESEEKFAEIDRRNAACYAGMEALTAKLDELRQGLESEIDKSDGVPEADIEWEDTSLVRSIDDFRQAASRGR